MIGQILNELMQFDWIVIDCDCISKSLSWSMNAIVNFFSEWFDEISKFKFFIY